MKSLKIIILLCTMSFLSICAFAQNRPEDSFGKISIFVYQPPIDGLPEDARAFLETKMGDIVTGYNINNSGLSQRFVMTAKIHVTQQDILPTHPVRISQKMDVTFIIGDFVENKAYASTTLSLTGVDVTAEKTFIRAFKTIKRDNIALQNLVLEAKEQIVQYYTQNCDAIMLESKGLALRNSYEEAIALLISVPNVCSDCYNQCQMKANTIYDKYLTYQGVQFLQKAKAAWYVREDYDGAEAALNILLSIDPNASCFAEANEFMNMINNKLRTDEKIADERRQAQLQAQWEFKLLQAEREHDRATKRIEGWSQFGAAIGSKFGPLVKIKRSIF